MRTFMILCVEIWWDHMEVQYREATIFFSYNHHHWSMCRLCGWQIISAGSPGMSCKCAISWLITSIYYNIILIKHMPLIYMNLIISIWFFVFSRTFGFSTKTNKTFRGCFVMCTVCFTGVVIYNISSNIFFACTTSSSYSCLPNHL